MAFGTNNSADAAEQAKMEAVLEALLKQGGKPGVVPGADGEESAEHDASCPVCGQPLPTPEEVGEVEEPAAEEAPAPPVPPAGPAKMSSIEDLLAKAKGTPKPGM